MAIKFTRFCVYAIKHSKHLTAGRCGTFHERRRWMQARRLLVEAERAGEWLPIIFAPAERTIELWAWGVLNGISITPEGTDYSFCNLKLFKAPRPWKTRLKKKSDGSAIPDGFIRSYVICKTPPSFPKV